jgi:hypothetical protein
VIFVTGSKEVTFVIASEAKQSHIKVEIATLRSQQRIAALPSVARNDTLYEIAASLCSSQ